jgi:hypothetical protein
MCKVSVILYFVAEWQMPQPPTYIFGQVATRKNASPLFDDELDYGHHDVLLSDEEKKGKVFLTTFVL